MTCLRVEAAKVPHRSVSRSITEHYYFSFEEITRHRDTTSMDDY